MNLFDFIKNRVNITDIVNEYASIKKAGIYYKGRCPFHQEKDASFTVSPHKQIFYCFGCHATGDVIAFIAQIEGCSQLEAAKFIIDKYNIELPPQLLEQKHELAVSIDQKNRYYHLCQTVADWCTQQLTITPEAQNYLNERVISQETIERFNIGYFPAGINNLKLLQNFVHRQGLLVKDLIDNSILLDSPKGLYSPFEDRIIFPIADHMGRFCGFGGRIFKPGDERAKYYNSRENNFFSKGSLLYGLHNAKRAIQKDTQAFLVEGYVDCIAMAQHGYPNTVATLGTACSSEHLKLLAHYTETLSVIFDGDAAGLRAMLRLTQLCWHANINIRIICLPKNEDPASFLGSGNTLEHYLEQAHDVFTFFITNAGAQFKQQSLKGKLAIVQELLAIIGAIDDRLKQVILLQQAADSLHLPFDVLQKECRKQRQTFAPDSVVQPAKEVAGSALEKKLFALVIEQPALLKQPEVLLLIEVLPETLQRIVKQYAQLEIPTIDLLISTLNDADKQLTYALVMAQDKAEPTESEFIIQTAMRQHWKVLTQKIKEKVAQAHQQNDQQRVTQLLEQLQELKKKIVTRSTP